MCLSYFENDRVPHRHSDRLDSSLLCRSCECVSDLVRSEPGVADAFIDALYQDARCGLYHNVRTARVGLGWPPGTSPAAYVNGRVVLNPERFPKALKAHLESFRLALLDERNRELREYFEKRFDQDAGAA